MYLIILKITLPGATIEILKQTQQMKIDSDGKFYFEKYSKKLLGPILNI
jgi:hypothetical protein